MGFYDILSGKPVEIDVCQDKNSTLRTLRVSVLIGKEPTLARNL